MKLIKSLFRKTCSHAIGAFSLLFVLFSASPATAQDGRISISKENATILSVFEEIEKQSGLTIAYNKSIIDVDKKVTINATNKTVQEVLTQVLKNTGTTFAIQGRQVIISREKPQSVPKAISGVIKDEAGEPIIGATVVVKGTTVNAISGENGTFKLIVPAGRDLLEVSMMGHNTIEASVGDRTSFDFVMKESAQTLEEVVITGMFTRKKESFTGTTTVASKEQLTAVGNQNVIQSLKTLDPAFIIMENNLAGSNPNALPDIEIRGATSISLSQVDEMFGTNPNQPLFMLDGFETTLSRVNNLDMNRVESVTILKDAASTAIYGAKAANGIVVIETIKPKPGKLQVYYSGDFSVQVPDLTKYNMMNAAEKLQFELLSGRYTAQNNLHDQQMELTAAYNAKYAEVQRGVDSYWLSEPLRIGYTIGNSLQVSGGSNEFMYGISASYKPVEGVMKGSGNNAWGGNINLTYRKGGLNINNQLSLNGNLQTESNYGSFSDYVNINPYYRKSTDKYLEIATPGATSGGTYNIANPLYNASLNGKNTTNSFDFSNNLKIVWNITSKLRTEVGLQVSRLTFERILFTPPENTAFDQSALTEKGRYVNTQRNDFGYKLFGMLTYGNVWKERHSLQFNLRGEIGENSVKSLSMTAIGFPPNTNGNPAFAFSYPPTGHPSASSSVRRQINSLVSANYSYDNRYMLDGTFRYDGTSVFGANRLFSPNYSFGAGWNLHNEHFMRKNSWLTTFRITANFGVTANQNAASTISNVVYGYYGNMNYFGQGLVITNLGNPDIEWVKSTQKNITLDLGLWGGRLNGSFSVYQRVTTPQTIPVTKPTSTGVSTFMTSAGELDSKGLEGKLSYTILRNSEALMKRRILWTVTASALMDKDEYANFGDLLKAENDQAAKNNTLQRYADGYSTSDIWAVRSLGIDPASGRELFMTKDGQQTFVYNEEDRVRVGSDRPKIQGVIGTNLTFKGLVVGFSMRYRYGADRLNETLFNKVENITMDRVVRNNQDKRALYDRWQNPGDVTSFKSVALTADNNTRLSSRFIQKSNELIGESLRIGWVFESDSWIRHLNMQSLRLTLYGNDIFYWSTIRAERGTNYPFARTFSLSINASF